MVEAMRNAGARDVKPGDQFSAVWVSGAGRTGDPRVFAYKLEPGAGKLADSLASALAAPKADPWAEHQAPVAAPAPVVAPAVPAPASSPVETARQLLAAGLDVNDVTAATGLSAQIVTALQAHYGWAGLGEQIPIRCFNVDPSVNSSLKFLRKTPWAREKVESQIGRAHV
mgnify:CR=1 FL=1